MRWMTIGLCVLACLGLAVGAGADGEMTRANLVDPAVEDFTAPKPIQVGEEIAFTLQSPEFLGGLVAGRNDLVWSEEIAYPEATYIAPHFSNFDLPEGAYLVVRDPENVRSWTYQGGEDLGKERANGFWGIHISGPKAVLELHSSVALPEGAVTLDSFAHGFSELDATPGDTEALCGTDDSGWAKCYQSSEPTIYSESRAVARLLINGTSACTGWLVGSEGHVMTNEHCIGGSSAAANTNFEFMAEGSSCSTSCASWGACSGTVVATSSTLVKLNAGLDYALVKLPTNPTGTYGYMQMRNSTPSVNERIYIPQHPAHWGKKIAVFSSHSSDGSGYAEIYSLSRPACSGSGSDIGYYADTQGGSSGSPVLAYSDHLVVSLHHCANCPNRGVPITSIISDLGSSVPADAIGSGGGPPPTGGCPSGYTSHTGSISNGQSIVVSQGSASGTIIGELDGTATDLDLYLDVESCSWWSCSWSNVDSGTSPDSTETVNYSGSSGTYRWRVVSYSGSGTYELCVNQP
ncbi:MAG: serine protease [Acidobacteriota bacterium]|nr:serine protease [Acidobacteriota bacterium]